LECCGLREALAQVEHTTVALGLVESETIGIAGQAPLDCNRLCLEYLKSHASRLEQVIKDRDAWALAKDTANTERDAAKSEANRMKNMLAMTKETLASVREAYAILLCWGALFFLQVPFAILSI
jgi:hypothetical protein